MGAKSRPGGRSAQAEAYRKWYGLARWKRRRRAHLKQNPFCVKCGAKGVVVLATVADHDPPHRGDPHLFWHGPLQSLCAPCHDSDKQREELGTAPPGVDADGWPLDRL